MKIYFFGTPEFAVPSLKMLAQSSGFKVQAVVTQPDKPGNRNVLTQPPIKVAAKALGLEVLQPEKIDQKLIDQIKKDKPDAIIVVAYGALIPNELLNLTKYGCINVHPSLLPKYRGASPIQEALLNGDKETGIAIMKIDEKLDHGPIYLLKRVSIEESDNFETLSTNLATISAVLLAMVLTDIENGMLTPIKQSDSNATFCRKISKEDGEIDWNSSAEQILNKIRALNPWPSTYTKIKEKNLKILEAKIDKLAKNSTGKSFKPGTVKFIDKETFGFQAKDKLIIPTIVQLEGKAKVTAKEFLNGYKSLLA